MKTKTKKASEKVIVKKSEKTKTMTTKTLLTD